MAALFSLPFFVSGRFGSVRFCFSGNTGLGGQTQALFEAFWHRIIYVYGTHFQACSVFSKSHFDLRPKIYKPGLQAEKKTDLTINTTRI